jgi:hypothetical protein
MLQIDAVDAPNRSDRDAQAAIRKAKTAGQPD